MSAREQSDSDFREQMLQAVMERTGRDRDDAEALMRRIADRLAGYTHAEVEQMHPLPSEFRMSKFIHVLHRTRERPPRADLQERLAVYSLFRPHPARHVEVAPVRPPVKEKRDA